jgi:hypothetical protein
MILSLHIVKKRISLPIYALTTLHHFGERDTHGEFGFDDFIPFARLIWSKLPSLPQSWEQRFEPYEGRVTTAAGWDNVSYRLTASFHPYQRDLLVLGVKYDNSDGAMPDLTLRFGAKDDGVETVELDPNGVPVLTTNAIQGAVMSRLIVESGEGIDPLWNHDARTLSFPTPIGKGNYTLLLACGDEKRREELGQQINAYGSLQEALSACEAGWEERYGESIVNLPEDDIQGLFARCLHGVLASYAPDVRCQAPPMGFAGICWQRPFPQDLSFIHPLLLRLGHLDIARSWVDYYARTLDQMQEHTQRIYQKPGVMWAWEYPIGDRPFMLGAKPGEPSWYQYEIHNAAYPARMAYETLFYIDDDNWKRNTAWPIIIESARFLDSGLKKEAHGKWSLYITPSSGQDEFGSTDAGNYLCSLFSAKYTLEKALETAGILNITFDEADLWRGILAEGLDFDSLLDKEENLYGTNDQSPVHQILGKEKHPIQLNPLGFLPTTPDEATVNAYHRRHDLCIDDADDIF